MNALITYDLKSDATDHNEVFLDAAETEGLIYLTKGPVKDFIYRLPQSTVWGRFSSLTDAIAAFNRAIELTSRAVEHPVEVRKRMAVDFSHHGIHSNVSIAVNPAYIGANDYQTALLHQQNVSPFKMSRARILRLNLASLSV